MDANRPYDRYRELQSYVRWTDEDALRIEAIAPLLDPHLPPLIDDFYAEIERHPEACKVITGGPAQVERLKGTLLRWVRELLAGRYDRDYVARRRRVGWRHVEIGLDQSYTNAALSRLRAGLCVALQRSWPGDLALMNATIVSLNTLLDLDLAILEEAYHAEHAERLGRAQRLATLGQVAGGIAHELRNPLNVVKTSVYFLTHAQRITAEKQAEHLARIERQVELADGVITTLSSFAKAPVSPTRPTPVPPCLHEALKENPPGEGVRVAFDIPPSLPPALADADQLRILFGNLIRNAGHAMADGGVLSIRAEQAGGMVQVAIADTGVGISEADLPKVLEPLYTTKARGLGLGLAIVRAILDKIGGDLRVESTPGRGSVFTVRLATSHAPDRDGSK